MDNDKAAVWHYRIGQRGKVGRKGLEEDTHTQSARRTKEKNVRENTIFRLPAKLLNITTLLQGDPNISNSINSLILKAVQDFLAQSGRIAME